MRAGGRSEEGSDQPAGGAGITPSREEDLRATFKPPRIESGPHVGHWVAHRLEAAFWEERHIAIGLVRDGVIIAGVIYENFNTASITAHMVVEGRLTRSFIAAIFDYPYRICRVTTVILPVTKANTRSVRLVEHMGFTAAATLTDCHPDGDLVLYTLRRADCRFLEGPYVGKENARSACRA